jgi:hypothetical protein
VTDLFEGVTEDSKAQLIRARDMTRRTGTLIEAQVLQLRLWPQVVFKTVLDVTIEPLDIEQKTVNYLLRVKKMERGRDLEKRIAVLEEWLRTLLGDDWMLHIKVRLKKGGPGRLLHHGQRKAPLEGPCQPVADLKAYEFKDAMTSFRRYKLRDPQAALEAVAASNQIKEK